MPECMNCGAHVTRSYVKVFAPSDLEGDDKVRVCPNCEEIIRDGKDVREARSHRGGNRGTAP